MSDTLCRNCGARVDANYCPQCGQETRLALPTLREFVRDAAGRLVAIDGRFWRTLAALLFRPGYLTREYLDGRRRRYLAPTRLFLASSLLVFAVVRLVGSPAAMMEGIQIDIGDPADAAKKAAEARRPSGQRKADGAGSTAGVATESGTYERISREMEARSERFRRLSADEKVEQLLGGVFRYGPYATFALLPAFAFLLQIAYLGRGRRHPGRPCRYAEHLVYGAHVHAFALLMLCLVVVVPQVPLRTLIIVLAMANLLRAVRVVYGGSWAGIVFRASVVGLAYLILAAMVVLLLFIAAILLR